MQPTQKEMRQRDEISLGCPKADLESVCLALLLTEISISKMKLNSN